MYGVDPIPPQCDNINISIRQRPSRVTLHALPEPSGGSRGGGEVLRLGHGVLLQLKVAILGSSFRVTGRE